MGVGTHLNFPFDAEVFNYSWKTLPDLFLDNIIASGAVQRDSEIARLISNGSNAYVVPYYNELGGTEQLYDGLTDFTYDTISGGTYRGVVYGRMKAWDAVSFIKDFNSGADPMQQIVNGVGKYWQEKRQERLVKLLTAIFSITGDADFAKHTLDKASDTATVTEDNIIGATTIGDAIVQANGDNAKGYSVAIMHSKVAQDLANLQLLEFSKYTDASGITRSLPIGYANGMLVIVNDGVPVDDNGEGVNNYTTFLLGNGAVKYEEAPVDIPVEMSRNPEKAGGKDMIYTRLRETFAPYGFSFKKDVSTQSLIAVPDTELLKPANWERKIDAKAVLMARVITN